ncbi:hypothetical protein M3R28_01895 [Pseudomonas syringae]|uniref:hypothetical protein n=1 Tax=Pseudomonas syringae TaxID=317 RepID=UPI0020BE465B|nr:hypothetical protein [Pseudomonas syringae]MCL6305655.1 hypothetical protein [Pseudomonas syringae]
MDLATCTDDGQIYSAHQFEQLDERTLEHKRRLLVCPQCQAPAFFRKESRSGQAACFGARPHADNCVLAAIETTYRGAPGDDQDERINTGERIEVDFGFGAHEVIRPQLDEPAEPGGVGGRYVGGSGGRSAVKRRRLSTILRNLMLSERFADSDELITLPEGEFRVRDFFIRFEEVTRDLNREYRGYWGMLSDARDGQSGIWLNSGGRAGVSIAIDDSILDEFRNRFNVRDKEDLAGAYVLVFGRMNISQYKKMYIACNDIRLITVSLAD